MSAHPFIRCSSLDQLFECPASRILMPLVAAREGAEAKNGTLLHEAIEDRLVTGMGAPMRPELYPPHSVRAETARNRVSGFDKWIVDYCFEALRAEAAPDWSLECEVAMAYDFDRFTLSGHIDALLVSPEGKRASAFDWKTGYRAVDSAESNNQALGYLVLLKRAYPQLEEAWFSIVQPRADEDEGEQRVSAVCLKGAELDNAVDYLERRVNAALDAGDEINSGPRQCRWCPVGLQCPAIQAELETMKMKLTPETLARIKREPDDRMLADFVVAARVVEQPIKDAKEMLHERLAVAGSINSSAGVSITQSEQAGAYKVTNPEALYSALCGTLPAKEVAQVVTPSVTNLKDAIARTLGVPKTGKSAVTAESVFAERFRPHMEQGTRRILKFAS